MKRHYEEHGYTEGCEGCGRLSANMKSRPHSTACRERMYREMRKTESGRNLLKDSESRVDEYLEEKLRKQIEEADEADRTLRHGPPASEGPRSSEEKPSSSGDPVVLSHDGRAEAPAADDGKADPRPDDQQAERVVGASRTKRK